MIQKLDEYRLLVLGTAQDGGYPHTGCSANCCRSAWNDMSKKRMISSIAIINGLDCYLFDITPDFRYQYQMIENYLSDKPNIKGIFITHAHTGHYSGILDLGLESMNTDMIPIYAMPKMKMFLENNAPFSQLIELQNIKIIGIEKDVSIFIENNIKILPIEVPHRNEFSETVCYSIKSIKKSALYIPDIDSWEEWNIDIINMIKEYDLVFLDGTFYNKNEIKNRNIDKIPHPSIIDTMNKFSVLGKIDRKKVNFIHLNHTNNVIRENSQERKKVVDSGYNIANDGMMYII